jgi:hypothetical protein
MCIAVIADVDGDEGHACESAAIMEISDIGEFASKSIERFDNDHVEGTGAEVR